MMESKGKRASRVAALIGEPAQPAEPAEIKGPAAEVSEVALEAVKSTEIKVQLPEAVNTAADLVAVAEMAHDSRTAEQAHPVPVMPATAVEPDASSAWAQSRAALARGLEALSAEIAGLTLKGIDATASAASKLLGVKTLSDAIAVNADFTSTSFKAVLGGSARLSELGVKLAAETSQPLLSQFGEGWIKAARLRR